MSIRSGSAGCSKRSSSWDRPGSNTGASGLSASLRFKRSPSPEILSETGKVEVLAAEGGGGHASSFDLALADEIGLFKERDRGLVNSMRSATSAKGGRFLAISIQGDGPFVPEILQMRDEPHVAVHVHRAPKGCGLHDRKAWRAANPGLGTIKSVEYMAAAARRAVLTPADESDFRAMDLNQPGAPGRAMLVSPTDWSACHRDVMPPRTGACTLGVDLGGSQSMTAAAAAWDNGRLEVWGALPGVPSLKERQRKSGQRLDLMVQSGHLEVHQGRRTVDVGRFLLGVADKLRGERIVSAGADRYRKAEMLEVLEAASLAWPMVWRGVGAGAKADGSHDVRAFQRRVLERELAHDGGLMLTSAIADSELRFDPLGNPSLVKHAGKLNDALAAGVIAVGLSQAVGPAVPGWRWGGGVV